MRRNVCVSTVLSAVLSVVLFASCNDRDNSVNKETEDIEGKIAIEKMAERERSSAESMAWVKAENEKQRGARALSNKFQEHFRDNTIPEDEYPENIIYPEYYAGDWINQEDKENRRWIVAVKGDTAVIRKSVAKIIGSNNFIIKSVTYSYKDLGELLQYINKRIHEDKNKEIYDNMSVWGIDTELNGISIGIKDCSEKRISEFKENIIDHPTLIFEQREFSDGLEEVPISKSMPPFSFLDQNTYNLYPGEEIKTARNGKWVYSSIGYRAKQTGRGGKEGLVVSGHGVVTGEIIYDKNSKAMGKCEKWSPSGDSESSFCTLYSDYVPSNTIYYGSGKTLSVNTYEPQKGNHINKSGKSTNVTGGQITDINKQINYKDKEYLVVQAKYASAAGDSGGIVYTDDGKTAGIHLASDANDSSLSYYIKANNINKALAVERY
ncbi:hypothetical protein Barb4_03304 [Bacteroidales bacterium Barb4]|nr:hypothetical protein Barb4_03304 [Bacteroidales bacterium Barb4]